MSNRLATPHSLLVLGDPIFPLTAEERVESRYKDGAKREAIYFIQGKQVGLRKWWNNGVLAYEWATAGEKLHGRWVRFHTNGMPDLESTYKSGKQHGIRVQFDMQGRVIGTCEFRHGDGVDLWFMGNRSGPSALHEEWHYQNDLLHGVERCWIGRQLVRERYWRNGWPHGILREWSLQGRPRRNTPEFSLNGKAVSKADYVKACESDPKLPVYSDRDNSASRPFPLALIRASRARVRKIRQRIRALPLVEEISLGAPKKKVLDSLRSLQTLSNLTTKGEARIQDHVLGRLEQSTASGFTFEWIDQRWKSARLARVTFHLETINADDTRTLVEFSHVGFPQSSRSELRRFWRREVFQKLLKQFPAATHAREVVMGVSFDDPL
jgi:antitoxin component YwqK of YwqJK toxin-antitoxin module